MGQLSVVAELLKRSFVAIFDKILDHPVLRSPISIQEHRNMLVLLAGGLIAAESRRRDSAIRFESPQADGLLIPLAGLPFWANP